MRPEYEKRLAAKQAARQRHERSFRKLGNWRLAVVVAAAAGAWFSIWTLPAGLAIFIALIVAHERVEQRAQAESRAVAFYRNALDRLSGNWPKGTETGERFRSPEHPYGEDLDLFGPRSLFHLLNTTRTSAGEETLARWLSAPAPEDEVLSRQGAIRELAPRLDLREDLAVIGEDVRAGIKPDLLARWGEAPPVGFSRAERLAALALTAATAVAFAGYLLHLWPLAVVLAAILAEMVFTTLVRRRVLAVMAAVDVPALELDVLARVLDRFEAEHMEGGRLGELRRTLSSHGRSAGTEIHSLRRLLDWWDWERNVGFAIAAKPLLWRQHFAMAVEDWRVRNGPAIRSWLSAVGELEALSSLAGYAAENPRDPFPELIEQGPAFDGHGIAHPLLPVHTAVRNDVRLDRSAQLLVVSGSNMSGKSTLLRAVGLNVVLAWAGAPVRAESLRVSRLSVGASIRVQDSVLEGKSRFYAEITRIRQIMDYAGGEPPLLFLLDEVLSGTNSHDRRIGAEAIIRALVKRGAIGLVTTHDLALAHIAEELAPRAANVHFEDHLENGVIAFDYRMRPGVVAKSNALELMRSVGLEV